MPQYSTVHERLLASQQTSDNHVPYLNICLWRSMENASWQILRTPTTVSWAELGVTSVSMVSAKYHSLTFILLMWRIG